MITSKAARQKLIASHCLRHRTVACLVAVLEGGEVHVHQFSPTEASPQMTVTSRFPLGSLSKLITALATLRCVERHGLALDKPVVDMLPWLRLPDGCEGITPHHLLSHTAGLPQVRDDMLPGPSLLLELASMKSRGTPGQEHHYSDIGFQILTELLVNHRKIPFAQILQEEVFAPLNMPTAQGALTHAIRPSCIQGFRWLHDDKPPHSTHPLVECNWFEYHTGDASVAASAQDLIPLMRMLLQKGVLSPSDSYLSSDLFSLFASRHSERGEDSWYGYGTYVRLMQGRLVLGHGGDMPGHQCMMLADGEAQRAVAVLMSGPGFPFGVAEAILRETCLASEAQGEGDGQEPEQVLLPQGPFASPWRTLHFEKEPGGHVRCQSCGAQGTFETLVDDADTGVADCPCLSQFAFHIVRSDEGKVTRLIWGDEVFTPGESGDSPVPEHESALTGHFRMQSPFLPGNLFVVRRGPLHFLVNPGNLSFSPFQDLLIPGSGGELKTEDNGELVLFSHEVEGKYQRLSIDGTVYHRQPTRWGCGR